MVEGLIPRKGGFHASTEEVPAGVAGAGAAAGAEAREGEPGLSLNAAVLRIGPRVGVGRTPCAAGSSRPTSTPGRRPGTVTADAGRLKELERENRELKRANEILLAASSFLARELCARVCPGSGVCRRPPGPVRG